jgi:hypothetical protein
MSAEGFKKSYVRWSYAVAVCITTILMTITLCDIKLGYDFSENMYIMSVVATGVLLALLSLTWISILNSKLFKDRLSSGADPKETLKEASSTVPQETPVIELTDIEQCIRKEGFVPVRKDNFISFKISGEEIEVFYNDEKLSLVRTYGLDDDVNLDILSQACSMLHDSTFLIRSSLHKYDNNQMGLVFEVQTMVTSPVELDRYFNRYLNLLYHGIERHREIYGKLLEESAKPVKEMPVSQGHEHKVVS